MRSPLAARGFRDKETLLISSSAASDRLDRTLSRDDRGDRDPLRILAREEFMRLLDCIRRILACSLASLRSLLPRSLEVDLPLFFLSFTKLAGLMVRPRRGVTAVVLSSAASLAY